MALLVVGGVKCDAYEQHHNRQEKQARKKVHGLQFTYLIDAALDLPMHKVNGDTEYQGAERPNKPERCVWPGGS